MIRLFIPGRPVAKGRPRFTRSGRAITPKATRVYERFVAMHAKKALVNVEPLACPVELQVMFLFQRPKKIGKDHILYGWPGRQWLGHRPDLSNLIKAVEDAIIGIVYLDDSQVVSIISAKMYAAEGETPGVHLLASEAKASEIKRQIPN